MGELDKEFEYYKAHQAELVTQYRGKFIVIRGASVDAAFDEQITAYKYASEKYAPGTFMIQQVLPGEDNYSQTYFSNATF